MIDLVKMDLERGTSKKQSEKIRKARKNNSTTKQVSTSKYHTSKNAVRKHGRIVNYNGNHRHKMTPEARQYLEDARDSYAVPQALQGFYGGIVSAATGLNLPATEKAKNSLAYKMANVGGQIYGYGVGYGGVAKLTGKAAAKVVGTKAGQKAITKAAEKKIIQTAAKKTLAKTGQNATKKAVEHAANKTAKKVGEGLVKNAVADATVGTLMDSNIARSQGYKIGSKEWNEEMAKNAALNFAVGGAVETVPTVIKGLSKGGSKKTVERIVNGKIKKVKVDKTYKDFAKEAAQKSRAVSIKNAKSTLNSAKREYDKAKKSVEVIKKRPNQQASIDAAMSKMGEAQKNYRKAQSDYTKVIKEVPIKTAELPKYNVKAKASYKQGMENVKSGSNTRLSADNLAEYINTGKKSNVTRNKNKMLEAGNQPILTSDKETKQYIVDAITGKVSNEVKAYGKVGDNFAHDVSNVTNGKINIKGKYLEINADDVKHSFKQHVHPKQEGDIPLSLVDYQKIPEYIDNYDDILEIVETKEGPRIMLGKQINGHSVITEIVRDNRDALVFKNMWAVDTKKYVEKYKKGRLSYQATSKAVEPDASYLFSRSPKNSVSDSIQDVNKYKDLSLKSAADVGPEPTATDKRKGLFYNVSDKVQNVNAHENFNHKEAFEDPNFVKFINEKSNGNMPNLARENGVSVNEQTRRFYEEYVKSKDLGADVYKPSNQKINAEKYGTDRGVVNATPYGETSQTAKTIYNSPMVDETTKRQIRQDINDGIYTKYTKTNKTAIDNATARVDESIDTAYNDFKSFERNNAKPNSETIALGYKLAESYQKSGDYGKVMEVLADVASMESEAGRTLQAMRIFNNLTPEGRIKSVVRNVNKLSKTTGQKVSVSEDLLSKLANATSEKELNQIKKAISVEMWNQIPPTWVEKANAWRYMSMLANPKTHIRNILGNAIFVPVKGMRNVIATGMEKALIRGGERTKAVLTHKDKGLVKLGREDFASVKDAIMGNTSRYFESSRDLDAKVFKSRLLEGTRKGNSFLLEKEDEIFMRLSYERSYAQYLKANGHTAGNLSEDVLKNAREYATNEALNSTYRDVSALSDAIAKVKKYAGMKTKDIPVSGHYETEAAVKAAQRVKKAGALAVEATMPFTKTPINILKRGVDYSPAGLINGISKMLKAKGNPEMLIDAISKMAEGLTGTAITMIGYYLGKNGFAQGSLDTSTAEGQYRKMMGEQEYSVKIGDYTYSFDWAVPVSMPLFIGVEAGSVGDEGLTDGLDALSKVTDPLFNLSMLSGLNTVLGDTYSSLRDGNPITSTIKNMATSYIGQFLPTVGGQLARTLTDETRTTTSTDENKNFREYERFVNKMKNKIPGLTDTNEPYVNQWGQTEKKRSTEDYLSAALQNFISPGTLKNTKKSSVDEEILRLGDKLGDMSEIVPRSTSSNEYDKKFKNENYHMSEKDLTAYKKAKGQYAKDGLYDLFDTKKYKNMSADEKRKAIKKVYDEAKDKATMEFLMTRDVSKEEYKVEQMGKNQRKAYKKSGMDIEEFEQLYKARKNVTDSDGSVTTAMKMIKGGAENYNQVASVYGSVSKHAYQNAKNLYNLGLKPKEITNIAKKADTNKNKHFTTAELVSYLNGTNYSQYEKRYIFAALANWNAHNPY